jgi:hypothetical protein
MKWEYKIEYFGTPDLLALNLLGREGWELVVVIPTGAWIFKCPVKPEPKRNK